MLPQLDWEYELAQFLGGTFHQDIVSPEVALQEYLQIQSKEWLEIHMACCQKLLKKDIALDEKESFITKHAEIHFPSINQEPINWLEHVSSQILARLKDLTQ